MTAGLGLACCLKVRHLRIDEEFWRGRRVLLTGHTGFKGAWLAAWLVRMGSDVYGLSLPAAGENNLSTSLRIPLAAERLGDIRDATLVREFVERANPEIVLHLAAQAIVRTSYFAPLETLATNVMGTAHVLEAVRTISSVKVALIVTSDKVYENHERGRPFSEADRLGGHDPYSTSKACAELVASSYRSSYFGDPKGPRVATARSGNVIGGGDWSSDRIVPDLVRAAREGLPLRLRNPDAVRPWQHVLDPLSGYLAMAQALFRPAGLSAPSINFAPLNDGTRTVGELVDKLSTSLGIRQKWQRDAEPQPREAKLLLLSSEVAKTVLGWKPQLDFAETVDWTAAWYRDFLDGRDVRLTTDEQIAAYSSRLLD
jgi:CDP-glucose 4,6-dehydratase